MMRSPGREKKAWQRRDEGREGDGDGSGAKVTREEVHRKEEWQRVKKWYSRRTGRRGASGGH